jgi:hypothetical protein
MTTKSIAINDIKNNIYKIVDQFPPERLPEIGLFLEQLLLVINNSTTETKPVKLLPPEENPWQKFAGMFKDDPDWENFQNAMKENREHETTVHKDWAPDFFEKTAGCLADDPIERAPQGDYEIREYQKFIS